MNCKTCGFGLWKYNYCTWTCKNGHRWLGDGAQCGPHKEWVPAEPMVVERTVEVPVEVPTVVDRLVFWPAAVVGAGAAVVIEFVARVLS